MPRPRQQLPGSLQDWLLEGSPGTDLSPLGLGALALAQAEAGVTEQAFFASEGLSLHLQKMERSRPYSV